MNKVEIIYALPNEQKSFYVLFDDTITATQALEQSRVLELYNLSLENIKIGVFGREISLDTQLEANDRLEIYRDLTIDPKQARMMKVARTRNKVGNNWRA